MPRGSYTGASFTAAKRQRYLKLLEDGHTFAAAAEAVEVSPALVWSLRRTDEEFREQVEASRERGIDSATADVEDSLLSQAKKGNVVAIQVWLYNRRPDRWRDRRNIEIKGLEDVLKLLPPELARRLGQELRRILAEEPGGASGGSARPNGRR